MANHPLRLRLGSLPVRLLHSNAKASQYGDLHPPGAGGGAEIRDRPMVAESSWAPRPRDGRDYHREDAGASEAHKVVVAGLCNRNTTVAAGVPPRIKYHARLATALACRQEPDDASNQAVFGTMNAGGALVQGPPSLSITEHWKYTTPQGLRRRLLLDGARTAAGGMGDDTDELPRPLGQALRDEMEKYNHQVGLKMVGEMLPDEGNR